MIRTDAQLPVSRFAELIDLPRRTYHYRLAKHRAGEPAKGPWPAPVVDRIEPIVAKYAGDWDAWGHRKIWALAHHDGVDVGSASSVGRAMARRGLLQPVRYQAERRQLAQARRAVFVDPPDRRNRVWQMDFSEFETTTGGIWRIGALCDYWAKPALAGRVAATATAIDLIATLDAAIASAEEQLGHPLILDCLNDDDVIEPIAVVTDNGGPMRSIPVARWFAARPHFVHIRTRARSPQTNGVIERFFQSLKYERLYRHDIADGQTLAGHVDDYLDTYNRIRPHEAIDWQRPLDRYLSTPRTTPTLKLSTPESEQNS
jgi:transposase InsO family protein